MKHFNSMLSTLKQMQLPILTVENLIENVFADEDVETKHIVIHANNGKTTDFVFIQVPKSEAYTLFSVNHLNMNLNEAIVHFSKITLRIPGAIMKLESL